MFIAKILKKMALPGLRFGEHCVYEKFGLDGFFRFEVCQRIRFITNGQDFSDIHHQVNQRKY